MTDNTILLSQTPAAVGFGLTDLLVTAQGGDDKLKHATMGQLIGFIQAVGIDQKVAPPDAEDFTIENSSTADGNTLSLVQKPGKMLIEMFGNTHAPPSKAYTATIKGAGSSTFEAIARLQVGMPNTAHLHFGLCMYDKVSHNLVTLGHTGSVGLEMNNWTNDGSSIAFQGNLASVSGVGQEYPFWARLIRNADGSISGYTSQDGVAWYGFANSTQLVSSDPANIEIGFFLVDELNVGGPILNLSNYVTYFEATNYPPKNQIYDPTLADGTGLAPRTAKVLVDPADAISPLDGDRWIVGNGAHAYSLSSPSEAVAGTNDALGVGCAVTFIQNDNNVSTWSWNAGDGVSCIRPPGRGAENLGQGSVVVARYIGARRWSITGDLGA